MKRIQRVAILIVIAAVFSSSIVAQNAGYTFTDRTDIPVTPVRNQYRSGTCWSFAAISYLEAELLRTGKGEYDLSEMFLVRQCYADKAEKYVRMHGKTNFGGGGLAHDLLMVWKKYGLVPEAAYSGLVIGEDNHIHAEMDAVLSGFVEKVIKNPNRKLTPVWQDAFQGILDAYLGEYPASFTYDGVTYTPETFAGDLGLDPDTYVTIGSFAHHPFYEPFILEIPDNWGWNEIDNVPLQEMMDVIDNALEEGHTVCWDADVSEKGFDWKSGVALIPEENIEVQDNMERQRWDALSSREQQALFYDFSSPKTEKNITQEIRQADFDNYLTTDDHLMHITGMAVDQDGKKFYKVKNSWGTENHIYDGYLYASEAFLKAKTIFVMVHKDAVPKKIAKKLGY